MKRFLAYSLLAVACSFAFATGTPAQTNDESDGTDVTVEAPVFVDADGDGINDIAAMRHHRRNNGVERAFRHARHGMMADVRDQLTDEQIAELDQLVADLRAGETERGEHHTAITEKLQEFGITLPENWNQTPGDFASQFRLSEEQRGEIQELVEGMRGEDASREDIRAAVDAKYTEWGIERPQMPGHGAGGPGDQVRLSEEQRSELRSLVEGMRAEDASRDDIHAAVEALHTEWGIEVPPAPERGAHGVRGHRRR